MNIHRAWRDLHRARFWSWQTTVRWCLSVVLLWGAWGANGYLWALVAFLVVGNELRGFGIALFLGDLDVRLRAVEQVLTGDQGDRADVRPLRRPR